MTRNSLLSVLGLSLVTLFLARVAQAEPYIGASVGSASIEASVDGMAFDEKDSAGKLMIGYIFDLPLFDLSLEASYVDFGAPANDALGSSLEIKGIDAFVVAGLDFGLVGAFVKAGTIAWDADARAGSFSSSSDGTDSAYGLGVRFNVASLFLRLEYERFDIDRADDVDLLSAGLVWRF
jgi:hypothetical protein